MFDVGDVVRHVIKLSKMALPKAVKSVATKN